MPKQKDKVNIHESLKKLEDIASWFEKERDFDIEEGLSKVKEGVALVKALRLELDAVENEFQEIKADLRPLGEEAA